MKIEKQIITLRKGGFKYKEISEKLNCSKSIISYYCRKNEMSRYDNSIKIPKNIIVDIQKDYDNGHSLSKLANKYRYSRSVITKYIKNKRKRQTIDERKKSIVNNVIYWRKKTKIKLVEYKDGKCEVEGCGYNKCLRSLHFHHIDKKEKDFSINGKTFSFDRLKKEIDKCVLVCSNCHGEIHEEIDKTGESDIVNKIVNKKVKSFGS